MSGVLKFVEHRRRSDDSFGTEFHRPGPCSPVTWRGRIYFLTDVSELRLGVLKELRAIHEARLGRRATIKEVDHWAARWRLIPVDPVADNWPRAVALATLEDWRDQTLNDLIVIDILADFGQHQEPEFDFGLSRRRQGDG